MAPPLYFCDEADEGEESVEENESGSEEEEVGPTGVPLTNRSRKALKICRHFSYALIYNAVDMGWEEQEIANLIKLVANQLSFDEAKLIRCLEKTSTGSPGTIACLLENSGYSFSAAQLVSVILSNARNVDHFITLMGEAFECSLFDLAHPETIDTLYSFVGNNMDYRESQRYARQLCEHSSSKRLCGRVLHKFTSGLTSSEAAAYMYDIITLDFFQDIRGSTKDLMKEIPRAQEQLEALLNASHNLDKDGEIVDSDADSEGNLRDFVVNSDTDEGSDDGDSGSESESDGDSEAGRRRHSSGSSSGSSDSGSDRDGDLSEEENSRYKPAKTVVKKTATGSGAKSSVGKGKASNSKSRSKMGKKEHAESEEEDWGSDSSHHSVSSSGSDRSSQSGSSGSRSSASSLPAPVSKLTKSTAKNATSSKTAANSAIKGSSQALKRKRIQDDSSDEDSETERVAARPVVNYAKKLKTESSGSSGSSTSASSTAKSVVKKNEKRIVLSDSESGGSNGSNSSSSDSNSSEDESVVVDASARNRSHSSRSDSDSSSGDSDSASSSGSDSSAEDIPPPAQKKGVTHGKEVKIKAEPGAVKIESTVKNAMTSTSATTSGAKMKAEHGAKVISEITLVKKEVVIKKEKDSKKYK